MSKSTEELTDEELYTLQNILRGAWWVYLALWLLSVALCVIFTAWFFVAVFIFSLCISGTGRNADDINAEIARREFKSERNEGNNVG